MLAINLDVGDVVLEHSGDIDLSKYDVSIPCRTALYGDTHLGESAFREHNQQTGLKRSQQSGRTTTTVLATFPQAPSPTMTSFLRISAMLCDVDKDRVVEVAVVVDCDTEAAFKRSLNPTALLPHHALHKLFPSYNPDCRASAALPRNSSTAPLSLSTTYVLTLSRRRGLDSKAVLFIGTQYSYTRNITDERPQGAPLS